MRIPIYLAALMICIAHLGSPAGAHSIDTNLARALELAGENRAQIEMAAKNAPADQQAAMTWQITHMPHRDLQTLRAQFLLDNCDEAFRAWRSAPWYASVSEEMLFDCILPYACINETRDEWRKTLRERCAPLIVNAKTIREAVTIINRELFPLIGVQYSTKRKQADQSPRESMESGLASCTGLAIILVDACRSVGIPARFAGIPMWIDGSGNHSWTEVWDGTWHFTGAAEATGDDLDKAWFTDRAAMAKRDNAMNAIYAVTWTNSPLTFPAAWRDDDDGIVRAINVTDRYTQANTPMPAGQARVRIRTIEDGERFSLPITIANANGEKLFSGTTNDEGFDANDHLTAQLPLGAKCTITTPNSTALTFTVERDEQLVTIPIDKSVSRKTIDDLRTYLGKFGLTDINKQPFASTPLSKSDASIASDMVWKDQLTRIRAERKKELESGVIEANGVKMPIWYKAYGEKPKGGRSLFISMHGGGGAPKQVNDGQWENQKKLYQPKEGIYVAPRAPTDTWNLWHEAHIDPLFTKLIEDMVIVEGVNPDRVYIMGYSAGGDGVYQLAPRMADQLAAASMMAGHPNETKPDGLRNLPFALHVGENDTPFDRNKIGAKWKVMLDELAANDPGGYPHIVEIHAGKGHWMDREDATALPWMASFTRNMRPAKVVWLQDDVTHNRFYWLATENPKAGARVIATRDGQTIRIEESNVDSLSIRLDDTMCDLDQPITLIRGDEVIFTKIIPRTIATIAKTIGERKDRTAAFTAEVFLPTSTAATK
ncbi:MAG: polyhydroxyalkanoate depolymerase [Planctomycetota bacterium]|nr:polyhydroxyalkanoate depolymerase [Planctomycetota bacterium]